MDLRGLLLHRGVAAHAHGFFWERGGEAIAGHRVAVGAFHAHGDVGFVAVGDGLRDRRAGEFFFLGLVLFFLGERGDGDQQEATVKTR